MPPDPIVSQQAPETPPQSFHTDHEAADLLSKFIAPKQPADEGRQRDQQGRFVAQQQEQQQEQESVVPPDQEATPDDEEQQPQEEEQEEEQKIEIDAEAPLFDVTVKTTSGDETRKVSLSDLRKGYMMQQDYSRKTAEIAEERRAIQKASQEALERERAQYIQQLQQAQALAVVAAAPEFQNVDMGKLAAENPAEYVRLQARQQQLVNTAKAIQAKIEEATQAQEKERETQRSQAAQESVKVLKEVIPDWNDTLYSNLLQRGVQTYGYAPDEIGQVVDHRFIRMLHDANAYLSMKDAKPLVEKKVAEVPQVPKRTGTRQPVQNQAAQQLKAARERLKTSGTDDVVADAMRLFVGPRR